MSLTAALNHHLEDVFDMFEMFFDMKKKLQTNNSKTASKITNKEGCPVFIPA